MEENTTERVPETKASEMNQCEIELSEVKDLIHNLEVRSRRIKNYFFVENIEELTSKDSKDTPQPSTRFGVMLETIKSMRNHINKINDNLNEVESNIEK